MGSRRNLLAPVLLVGTVLCVTGAAYLSFELGRYRAGFSLLDARRLADQRLALIAEHEQMIENLQRQVAIVETAREIDRETYQQIERSLSELQSQIQAKDEELEFYRGIVAPDDGTTGLRIQSFEIEKGDTEREFLLRLVLVQAIVHSQTVAGSVRLAVTGMLDGEFVRIELPELVSADDSATIGYRFRYFETIERQVQLPDGFMAATVELEITPAEPRGEQIRQSVSWSVVSG